MISSGRTNPGSWSLKLYVLWGKWSKVVTILLKNPNCPLPNRRNFLVTIMLISTHQPAFRSAYLSSPRLAGSSLQRVPCSQRQRGQMLEKEGAAASSLRGIWGFQNDPLLTYLRALLPCCCFRLVSWQKSWRPWSRAGKVGLCSAGLLFKGLFGHNGPYHSCRLRCQGEELMFHSARQEIGSFSLYVL